MLNVSGKNISKLVNQHVSDFEIEILDLEGEATVAQEKIYDYFNKDRK